MLKTTIDYREDYPVQASNVCRLYYIENGVKKLIEKVPITINSTCKFRIEANPGTKSAIYLNGELISGPSDGPWFETELIDNTEHKYMSHIQVKEYVPDPGSGVIKAWSYNVETTVKDLPFFYRVKEWHIPEGNVAKVMKGNIVLWQSSKPIVPKDIPVVIEDFKTNITNFTYEAFANDTKITNGSLVSKKANIKLEGTNNKGDWGTGNIFNKVDCKYVIDHTESTWLKGAYAGNKATIEFTLPEKCNVLHMATNKTTGFNGGMTFIINTWKYAVQKDIPTSTSSFSSFELKTFETGKGIFPIANEFYYGDRVELRATFRTSIPDTVDVSKNIRLFVNNSEWAIETHGFIDTSNHIISQLYISLNDTDAFPRDKNIFFRVLDLGGDKLALYINTYEDIPPEPPTPPNLIKIHSDGVPSNNSEATINGSSNVLSQYEKITEVGLRGYIVTNRISTFNSIYIEVNGSTVKSDTSRAYEDSSGHVVYHTANIAYTIPPDMKIDQIYIKYSANEYSDASINIITSE